MTQRRRLRMVGALAAAAAVVLTPWGATGVGADSAPAPAGRHAASSEPSGTLRMSNWQETPSMDPQMTTVQNGVTLFPVYDTLTSINDDLEAEPWLATSWEQVDALTWRFELRDDVTFHDGTPFDAEAVKVNLERGKTLDGSPYANVYGPIDSVTVVDDYTADVNFTVPAPNFDTLMSTLAGAMISPAAIEEGLDLTRATAGSGGWTWDADAHVEGSLHVYEANPDYWNPDVVKVERIELSIIEDGGARRNALESGQIDIMATVREPDQQPLRDAGFEVFARPTNTGAILIHDRGGELVPALADERVREAIGLLIDRNAINAAVYSGVGDPTIGGFAAPGTPFYNPEIDELNPPEADVERALELLAEAGYEDGFDIQLGNQPVIRQINEAIAQLLAAGNIRAEIVDVGSGQYTAAHRDGEFGIGYFVPTSVDIWNWWSRTVSNNGPYNPWGLTDLEDLEERYLEATNSTDFETQYEIMTELQIEAMERGIIFPLGQGSRGAAVSPNVGGIDEMVFGPDDTAPRPFNLFIND